MAINVAEKASIEASLALILVAVFCLAVRWPGGSD
jgi:hypothetical protein